MCLNKRIYKILTLTTIVLSVTILTLGLVSCNTIKDFERHIIPYDDENNEGGNNTRLAIIRSREELENYFSQENYITKGDNYDEITEGFNEDFFNEYVLIAATEDNNAKLTVKKQNDTIKLIYKDYNKKIMVWSLPRLQFLQIPVKFVGNATKIVREDI